MSLIDSMMDTCAVMDKERIPDGEGGFDTTWKEGAEVQIAVVLDDSTQAKIAQQEGFTNVYTLTFHKSLPLEFHDVIKRKKDGLILRVTSDVTQFPDSASSVIKDYAKCSAEKWSLT